MSVKPQRIQRRKVVEKKLWAVKLYARSSGPYLAVQKEGLGCVPKLFRMRQEAKDYGASIVSKWGPKPRDISVVSVRVSQT